MKMKERKSFLWLLVFGMLRIACLPLIAEAFNDNAHIELSKRAVNANISNLNNYLRTVLRYEFFPDGVGRPLKEGQKGTVEALISEVGAIDEDWFTRPVHHFHNPTKPWGQGGLWWCSLICESSIVWSQDQNQFVGGKHSWYDARNNYYQALTATSESERKSQYAEAFKSLGYLIHLVQDAAVPSHTRDDSHFAPFEGNEFPDGDPFHFWAEQSEAQAMISNLTFPPQFSFPTSFLGNQSSDNPSYPIPTARLTDTTAGALGTFPYESTIASAASGGGISVSGMSFNVGLGEYSNGNFFSKDTIFPETFQYPGLSNVDLHSQEPVSFVTKWGNLVNENRQYFYFKPGFGETDYKLAQGSSLRMITGTNVSTDIGLDPIVYADYGRKLFPRAVAYSAGLIDYFFRGKIDSTLWPTGYLWVPWDQRPNSIRVENVTVKNDAPNEQSGAGTMRLVLMYSYRYANTPNIPPKFIVSQEIPVSAGTQTIVFPFDALPFPATFPSPTNGSHGYVYYGMLVFKGTLGQESQAVVADSYCIDPNNGSRYDRWYVFEHAGFLDGQPIESAYMSEC